MELDVLSFLSFVNLAGQPAPDFSLKMQLGGHLLQEAPQALRADLILCSHPNLSCLPCQVLGNPRAAAVSLSLSALELGAQEMHSQCLWSQQTGRGGILSEEAA